MNRKKVGIRFLASVLCLFISACATSGTVEDTVVADGPRGAVLLQRVDDSWFKTAHPVSVSPLLLTHVLRGVEVQPAPEGQTTALRVFSEEEIAFLSPLLSTALSKATKNQLVAFRVVRDREGENETTGGLLFTRGRLFHLWLTHYRAPSTGTVPSATLDRQARHPKGLEPRRLRFLPETVQRPSLNQQPDVIDPPPLATLIIDYRQLAAQVNLPSEAVPAPPLHGDGPSRNQAETQSARPDHGLSTAQDAPPSRDAETQALKDVVKEQAIELDALKKDVRALRQRLSEMNAQSPNPMKQELAPLLPEKDP